VLLCAVLSQVALLHGDAMATPAGHSGEAPVLAHHAVSTRDAGSQALFDRGLTLFYAYNGSEGVHVFESLERREPKLAMAYWGEALSYGRDFNQALTKSNFTAAHAAIEKAGALAAGASEPERVYIAAMRLRYVGQWKDHDVAETAYRNAMAKAFAKYPSDDDLGALYVEALLENDATEPLWKADSKVPARADTLTMVRILDAILAHDPNHLMANHLVVHVFELCGDRQRALSSAERLNTLPLAPEDEHLAHMAVHAYIRAGRYDKAVAASHRAIALFDRYLATPGIDRTHASYIWHDILHGHLAAMMSGSYSDAMWFVKRLQEKPKHEELAALTAARFARWTDVERFVPRDSADPAHLARALWYLHSGRAEQARAELPDALDDKGSRAHLLYALRGAVDMMEHKQAKAQANFAKALALEKKNHAGAEIPLFPTGEILGGAYFRAADYANAENAYRQALERYPGDARALYGLSEALKQQNKSADAQSTHAEFLAAWNGSDTQLEPSDL